MDINLGEKLGKLRREKGLSQRELADKLELYGVEVSNQAVSKWEKGLTQPSATQFLAVCRALGAENIFGEFFGGQSGILRELNADGVRRVREYADILRASGMFRETKPKEGRLLPLYSMAVSAGTGQFLDSSDYDSVLVGAEVPDTADFGVRISGDSMEPRYRDGENVWIQRRQTLKSGEIGIFLYDDNAYLKQLIIDSDGIYLHSLNPRYEDIKISSFGELRVFGKAVT